MQRSRNSPNLSNLNLSPIRTPLSDIHPNVTVRDRIPRTPTTPRTPITPITPRTPITPITLRIPDENMITPPPHPNVTLRERRPPSAPRRTRIFPMNDEDDYNNTLLNLENTIENINLDQSLVDNSDWDSDDDNIVIVSPTRPQVNNVSLYERYGINAAIPDTYDRYEKYDITRLSNKELDTHKGKIKIEKSQTVYDPINMEDVTIQNYVNEDVDNIVFLYENNYFLSTKSRLKQIIDMTTTDNAIVFDCRGIGYQNINVEYPYVLINQLGIILNDFINVISLEDAISITKPTSGQYFIIQGSHEVLISTVTDNVLNGRDPNALAASHCQGGKSTIVFNIQKFTPDYNSSKTRKRKYTSGMSKTRSRTRSKSKSRSKSRSK